MAWGREVQRGMRDGDQQAYVGGVSCGQDGVGHCVNQKRELADVREVTYGMAFLHATIVFANAWHQAPSAWFRLPSALGPRERTTQPFYPGLTKVATFAATDWAWRPAENRFPGPISGAPNPIRRYQKSGVEGNRGNFRHPAKSADNVELLLQNNPKITWHHSNIAATDRNRIFDHPPLTLWLTGLSGAGKSTLAFALEECLLRDKRACVVLDGDNVRHGLCCDLSFSHEDRSENIRRVAEVARLMNDAGLIVITAFISPYHADRALARSVIGDERFIEVFLNTPLSACESRDPKGLYRKARAGEISCFTGIGDVYEPPQHPALSLNTTEISVDESVRLLMTYLAPIIQSAQK